MLESQSPDLSRIEMMCHDLKQGIQARQPTVYMTWNIFLLRNGPKTPLNVIVKRGIYNTCVLSLVLIVLTISILGANHVGIWVVYFATIYAVIYHRMDIAVIWLVFVYNLSVHKCLMLKVVCKKIHKQMLFTFTFYLWSQPFFIVFFWSCLFALLCRPSLHSVTSLFV